MKAAKVLTLAVMALVFSACFKQAPPPVQEPAPSRGPWAYAGCHEDPKEALVIACGLIGPQLQPANRNADPQVEYGGFIYRKHNDGPTGTGSCWVPTVPDRLLRTDLSSDLPNGALPTVALDAALGDDHPVAFYDIDIDWHTHSLDDDTPSPKDVTNARTRARHYGNPESGYGKGICTSRGDVVVLIWSKGWGICRHDRRTPSLGWVPVERLEFVQAKEGVKVIRLPPAPGQTCLP